jgi:exoribonuclease R
MTAIEGQLTTKDYRRFSVGGQTEFEGAALAGRALPGDTVIWNGEMCRIVCRAPGTLFLVGTVELSAKTRYGMSSRGVPVYRFTPIDEAYPPFFVGCSQRDTHWNLLGRIQFESWGADSSLPKGVLVQTFGAAGNLEAEEAALLAHYGAARWKRGEAGGLLSPGEASNELLEAPTFHIDPPGCRDIDDAVTLCDGADGATEVHIHIADVASWLASNGHLAEKAATIGQTLYRDGAAVRPMFPLEMSEGAFSLLPGESRRALTLTVRMDLEAGQNLGQPRWAFHQIRVKESHTYETAATAAWAKTLARATQILAGGAAPSADPHDWVEALMLFYNRSAAAALRARGQGVLRRHAAPDLAKLAQLRGLGLPAEKLAMRAGEYCEPAAAEVAHWGLGAAAYCHASSPIRRWADCVNQLALRDWILGTEDAWGADIAALNVAAKRAKQYERDLLFLRALVGPDAQKKVAGVVVEDGRIWIEAWGRIVRAETRGAAPGTAVRVFAFADETRRNWKRRLVLRVDPAA